ncbi:hypothetical protein ACFL45_09520 [Candidatus Neomarinimicrobiota bacterium]
MTDQRIQELSNKIEDYEQTVQALLAFAAFVVHDGQSFRPSSRFGLGRRMLTSEKNIVNPSADITPDLVAQKSSDYGIIAEAKKSLSKDQENWLHDLTQLRKYDDDLVGWWTGDEKITTADTILLVHISRSRQFARFFSDSQTDEIKVGPNTSIVEFSRADESTTFFFFRLEEGNISDKDLAPGLEDGIPVPLDKVLESFGTITYYDREPPIVFLVKELWLMVFPEMASGGEFDEAVKSVRFEASVSKVTKELQNAWGSGALFRDSRSREFPKIDWVRNAFNWLVDHQLAFPPTANNDSYTVLYKTIKGDVQERFIRLEVTAKKKAIPAQALKAQATLFNNE